MVTRRIKCRFCNFTVTPFYRTKGGRTRDWFTRMAAHVEYAHGIAVCGDHDESSMSASDDGYSPILDADAEPHQ